ncbi:RNB domain-containing ribonuclease [Treponema sp. R80B11-R83G3]
MITCGALVIYKNKPAIVKDHADGKFSISLQNGEQVKVRDKDIETLHAGPVNNFNEIERGSPAPSAVREAWELLSGEGASLSLKDLAGFIFNEYTPSSAYAAYCALKDGLYFCGTIDAVIPRSKGEVISEESKREAVRLESGERMQFLNRLKARVKNPATNKLLPEDARYLQDVEALAFGKSIKSRTMRDLTLSETPEDAHLLLLKTGFWTGMVNPHPSRFGVSLSGASVCPASPPEEQRCDLCSLAAFAIDSPWSHDPDDAVSVDSEEGKSILYVHVADPAASISFDSPEEKEARDRGATLYLPEGAVRMLAQDAIPMFALGLSEKSFALTFKMTIDKDGAVLDTEIFPSVVKVLRMTYEEADRVMDTDQTDSAALRELFSLSQKIYNRRMSYGAVNIDLPGVHITVENEKIEVTPIIDYRSSFLVKECMIAAGEGAGNWAAGKRLPFPYISQEVEMQGKVLGGFAGSMQLRKCMRPRTLSVKPGRHQGLGLDTYTQVTSPLRRYTDLLAHIQIRAFLRGDKTLSSDDVSARLGFSEAAVTAAVHAERASDNHWKMVYLSDKKDSVWDAVATENKGSRWAVIIPRLALEAQVSLQRDVAPNDRVKLILKSANIAKGEAVFTQSI